MYDIAIIGAGVVGGLIARELMRYRLSVVILEAEGDVAMGATRANSAIVHAGFDAKEGSLKAKFNVRGSEMMESVAEELGVKYKKNGSLVVGFSEEDRKTLEGLYERGVKNGVRELSLLSRSEILEIEPNIGDGVTCALRAGTGAIICPYELCIAAVGNAMDNGAELRTKFRVSAVAKAGEGWKISAESGECVESRFVVNSAGVFSDVVAKMALDTDFYITPRRGEYMLLDKECGGIITHTVFRCPSKMGKGILVSPTVDGNLLLGPTAEDIEDRENTDTTPEGLALVRAQAGEQVKGIGFGRVITSFTGLRSTGSTGDFVIEMREGGFLNLAGIESPGLSSSPAIAEEAVRMLGEAGLALVKNEDFNPRREAMHAFREMTLEEKSEVIEKRPEYAHVVCRCETVTEGEILAAIRANPRPTDLDGVKRRTRSTMGRCQGGFCSPYIVELLAREYGCAYTEVTKSGGGSYINVGKTKGGE